jgi:hypothetical protein
MARFFVAPRLRMAVLIGLLKSAIVGLALPELAQRIK